MMCRQKCQDQSYLLLELQQMFGLAVYDVTEVASNPDSLHSGNLGTATPRVETK